MPHPLKKYIVMFKILIVLLFLAVVVALFSGLYFLMKDRDGSKRIVTALSWRVGLAATLVALIVIGVATGLLEPHGISG
jgi:uncharacterized iron-regulated membrane protein